MISTAHLVLLGEHDLVDLAGLQRGDQPGEVARAPQAMQAFLEPEIFDGAVSIARARARRAGGRQLQLVDDHD
ncbi:MAG: hypothetical protein ACRDMX_01290 [Solirubrobacteraceae bacterium]